MSKIEAIKRFEIIDQKDMEIKFFEPLNEQSGLKNYNIDFENTTKILIASTKGLNDSIIEQLQKLRRDISIYIILSNFKTQTKILAHFDDKMPAIIREVPTLKNNFILTDNDAYLFVNSLSEKQNLIINLKENHKKDLYYLFNYYFWDEAKKEKILKNLDSPKQSPYPKLLISENKSINVIDNSKFKKDSKFDILITPRSINSKEDINSIAHSECLLSGDINENIYIQKKNFIIGNLKIKNIDSPKNLGNLYRYTEDSLKNIKTNIIGFEEDDWNTVRSIKNEVQFKLGEVSAKTIEDMKSQGIDKKKPQNNYSLKIKNTWTVLPPIKPKDAKKAQIYEEYKKLNDDFDKNLQQLKQIQDLKKGDKFLSMLQGFKNTFSNNQKQLESWEELDFSKLKFSEIRNKIDEFKEFYNSNIATNVKYDSEKKRKAAELKFNTKKAEQQKQLNQKREELKSLSEENLQIKEKDQSSKDNKKSKKNEKRIQNLTNEINNLKNQITKKFTWTDSENDIQITRKSSKSKNYKQFIELKIPRYSLPEVGSLYENKNNYYLEIENYEDLELANKISDRYKDKTYNVVAKE